MKLLHRIREARLLSRRSLRRVFFILGAFLIFCLGGGFGLANNPRYLAWSEQQSEINSQVSAQKKKIQADYDDKVSKIKNEYDDKVVKVKKDSSKELESQVASETKTLKKEYDQKLSDAKKSLAANEKTKIVEKKVPTVPDDCEPLITRYNNLFKWIDSEGGNQTGIASDVTIAHSEDIQSLAKNCLDNQSYVPRGVVNGKVNQILWDNWK